MTVRMVASTPPREVEEPAAPPSTPTPQSPFIPDVTTRRVHPCAYCGIDGATHKCIKCKSGPRSAGAARDPARYCDDLCKDAHLPAHEADCKLYQTAKEVRALRRAGELLSDLFCIWREGCCDRPIVKVEQINERIFVYEDWEERMRTYPGGRLFPLSEDLFPNAEVKRAVLCNMSCDLSLAVLSDLFGFLLQGISATIEEVEVIAKCPTHPISILDSVRGRYDLQGPHHLLRVKLNSGSTWSVDITSAQFGWSEVVRPWTTYVEERCERVVSIRSLGGCASDFQMIIDSPEFVGRGIHEMTVWTYLMGDMFSRMIQNLMDHCGATVSKLLNYSDRNYTHNTERLLLRMRGDIEVTAWECNAIWIQRYNLIQR